MAFALDADPEVAVLGLVSLVPPSGVWKPGCTCKLQHGLTREVAMLDDSSLARFGDHRLSPESRFSIQWRDHSSVPTIDGSTVARVGQLFINRVRVAQGGGCMYPAQVQMGILLVEE